MPKLKSSLKHLENYLYNDSTDGKETLPFFINFFSSSNAKDKSVAIAENILKISANMELQDKWQYIQDIDALLLQGKAKNQPDINARIKQFKLALSGKEQNWQERLLNIVIIEEQNVFGLALSADISLEKQIELNTSRFKSLLGKQAKEQNSYAIIGSTFATNNSSLLHASQEKQPKDQHCLDAIYAVYTQNASQVIDGAIIGIADGCGGHYGLEDQDKVIGKTAYRAIKTMTRLMATYTKPEKLKEAIPLLVKLVSQTLKRKFPINSEGDPIFEENTTLVCGRIFLTQQGYRFVGLSIGDCLMFAWSAKTQSGETILPGQIRLTALGKAPACIPSACQLEEIFIADKLLPEDTLFFPLTDGVYEQLDCDVITKQYENGSKYEEISLNKAAMKKYLSLIDSHAPVQKCTEIIANCAISRAEELRQKKLQNSEEIIISNALKENEKETVNNASPKITLGDDFTLYGFRYK